MLMRFIMARLEHIMLKYMPMLCFYYSHYYAQNNAKNGNHNVQLFPVVL